MNSPLVSIVVPTKDRYYYLKKLIELVESFKSSEIELVIQDNSNDYKDFESYICEKDCNWIVYNHVEGQIPMSTNSDLAILNSHGEYVCFVGDDDGVTRYLPDCAKWMKANQIDAVLPAKVNYFWPDAKRGRVNDNRATLHYNTFSGIVRLADPFDELCKLIDEGFINRGNVPLVYHGVVSRAALDKIYAVGGTYFPGSSPDISNAVALCLSINKYAICDIPITISGASKFHGGGTDILKNKQPQLCEIPWLLPDAEVKWDGRLPKIGIGESIWADSAIKALMYMHREDLANRINFKNLYAVMWLNYPDYRDCLNNYNCKSLSFKCLYMSKKIKLYFNAACHLITRKLHLGILRKIEYNIPDIYEAELNLVSNYNIDKLNESFKNN